jgi:hypothetical protein
MKRPLLSTDPDGALLYGKSPSAYWDEKAGRFVQPKAPRQRPEAAVQIAIKNRLALYGCVCVSIPNEGKRSAIAGRAMKATGMMPGFPDLIVMQRPGRIAFLEVKAPKGRVSPAQERAHELLDRLGFHVAVVRSQDEAVEQLRAWGFSV